MTVSEERRCAQRRIVATVRTCGVLSGGGLAMWREHNAGEWKASAAKISADLTLLGVPNTVVPALRPPLSRSLHQIRRGEEVRIANSDVQYLVRWMPSLQKSIDRLPPDAPTFAFVYFEPQADSMLIMKTSGFAAEWPNWSDKQATAMGLMCAECGFDLRRTDADQRAAFNIPALVAPRRRRLVCGQCCNDGLDQMERLAADSA